MSTIKDVAKLAGVSVSTVSRTLSGKIFVEEETKQKVLEAVQELNYKPNVIAKGLREGRFCTIALIVPDINSLFYPALMKNIEKEAAEKGYSLILCNTNDSVEKEKQAIEMLSSRGVAGIICMSVEDDIRNLVAFQKETNIPVVLINRCSEGNLGSVSIDDEHGGYLMTKILLEKGHRKIAGMFGSFEKRRFRERYNGCKRAMEEFGITDYKRYFVYDVDTIDEACQRTVEILQREERPTAFFATIDMMTIGIYSGISQCNLQIPKDVSVVGFDDIFVTKHMIPPLTTYHAPIEELAGKAVEMLVNQIENNGVANEIIVQGKVKERQSVMEWPLD